MIKRGRTWVSAICLAIGTFAGIVLAGPIFHAVDETPQTDASQKGKGFNLTGSFGPGSVVHANAHRNNAQGAADLKFDQDGTVQRRCIHIPNPPDVHTATGSWSAFGSASFDVKSAAAGNDARLLIEIKTQATMLCDGVVVFDDKADFKLEWIWLGAGGPTELSPGPLVVPIGKKDAVLGNNGGFHTARHYILPPDSDSGTCQFLNDAVLYTTASLLVKWDKIAGTQVDGVVGDCDADIQMTSELSCQ